MIDRGHAWCVPQTMSIHMYVTLVPLEWAAKGLLSALTLGFMADHWFGSNAGCAAFYATYFMFIYEGARG